MADSPLERHVKDYAYGRASDELVAEMRSTEMREVVRQRLADMVDSINKQIADRQDNENRDWRDRSIRLVNRLEDMLAEFDALCESDASLLRAAIKQHRDEILTGERDGDDVDAELWAMVE